MAAPTCRFYNASNSSYLDINDGSTYNILEADMGATVRTFDEYRSYSGSIAQYNVTTANLIDMRLVIRVKSNSVANLRTALAAINTKVNDITAGTTHFIYDGTTYHLMSSQPITWVEDATFHTGFWTDVELGLNRNTDVA